MRYRYKDESRNVKKAANRGIYKSLGHAAASLRRYAIRLIRRSKEKPSPVGEPPRTRRGLLRKAIVFSIDKAKQTAVIGPRRSIIGLAAEAHEKGKRYKGQKFPARPFMGPTLEHNKDRIPRSFRGSIIGP